MERGDPNSKIETDLALHRERLECHGSIGTTHQNVGAEPGTDGRFPAHPRVVTARKPGPAIVLVKTTQGITPPPPIRPTSSPNFVITPP
jgi:hypothetical protein